MNRRIITWDHREQPDWLAIDEALFFVWNGTHRPSITQVADTGSDQYAVVVSSQPVMGAEAQEIWDRQLTEDPEALR